MFVSVIVCTFSSDNYENFTGAVDSLLHQTHKEIEIIIVVHGNETLYERTLRAYDAHDNINIIGTKESLGAYAARNVGVRRAQGDVIAFLDDDAVAEKGWISSLVDTYENLNAIAVGGKILPIWLCKEPDYFPEELHWLVGVTHKGFAQDKVSEIRNAFGPNMSFRKEVFAKIGLFNENFGFAKKGTSYIQAGEAEFALRMKSKLGKGVIYNPGAIVYHKIPQSKIKVKMLLKRAFYQGYSKALLRKFSSSPGSITTEKSYLKGLLLKYIPQRIKKIYHISEVKKLSILVAVIVSVGLGFVYGFMRKGDIEAVSSA